MKHPLHTLLLLFLLSLSSLQAQTELVSAPMEIKAYSSTVVLPITDAEKNVHIFGISDNAPANKNIVHIKYARESNRLNQTYYEKPEGISFKEAVGIAVDDSNTVQLYFHNDGKGEFLRVGVKSDGQLNRSAFTLKTKKENILQYLSVCNQFMMLTILKNQSVLNLYKFSGDDHEKITFDLSNERFYSKDSKLVSLYDIIGKASISSIVSSLSNRAKDFGERIKIYPKEDSITLTMNNNDNGTRIITLNTETGTATGDYVPMPTKAFAEGAESSIRTNSFLYKDKIFSAIVSTKLMLIDVKDVATKEVLSVLKFSPDQKINLEKTRNSVLPIGPISIATSNTKQKEKNAKSFFRDMKYALYSGVFVSPFEDHVLLKMGGYSPPTTAVSTMSGTGNVTAGKDAFGNVTISSTAPVGTTSTGYSTSYGFEAFALLDGNTYQAIDNTNHPDVYDKVEQITEDQKGVQLETLLSYEDYVLYGYYNKKENIYRLFKVIP